MSEYTSKNIVLTPQKGADVKVKGGQLNCIVEGSGESIVFLHGLGENGNFFTHQFNVFRKDHKVIAVDQRGFGLSSKPKEPEPVSLAQWSDDVRDVLDELSVKRATIVGHSFGGSVALKFAIDQPEMTSGVVTLGGLAEVDAEAWRTIELWVRDYEKEGIKGYRRMIESYKPEWDFNEVFVNASENRNFIERWKQVLVSNDPWGWTASSAAIKDFNFTSETEKIRCPTLLMCGDLDLFSAIDHNVKLCKTIPNSILRVVSGVGHNPHIEVPELTNKYIRYLFAIEKAIGN